MLYPDNSSHNITHRRNSVFSGTSSPFPMIWPRDQGTAAVGYRRSRSIGGPLSKRWLPFHPHRWCGGNQRKRCGGTDAGFAFDCRMIMCRKDYDLRIEFFRSAVWKNIFRAERDSISSPIFPHTSMSGSEKDIYSIQTLWKYVLGQKNCWYLVRMPPEKFFCVPPTRRPIRMSWMQQKNMENMIMGFLRFQRYDGRFANVAFLNGPSENFIAGWWNIAAGAPNDVAVIIVSPEESGTKSVCWPACWENRGDFFPRLRSKAKWWTFSEYLRYFSSRNWDNSSPLL